MWFPFEKKNSISRYLQQQVYIYTYIHHHNKFQDTSKIVHEKVFKFLRIKFLNILKNSKNQFLIKCIIKQLYEGNEECVHGESPCIIYYIDYYTLPIYSIHYITAIVYCTPPWWFISGETLCTNIQYIYIYKYMILWYIPTKYTIYTIFQELGPSYLYMYI